jgi:hypothetical protein
LRKILSRFALAAALGVLPVSAVTVTATPAFAASCSGSSCSFLDPYQTGCSSGSYPVMTQYPSWGGEAQLWWSPACQTNWTVYHAPGTSGWTWSTGVGNNYGQWDYGPPYTGSLTGWTDQLYSPGPATMCVSRTPSGGGQTQWACWTQPQ